jgi:hypothetical protein
MVLSLRIPTYWSLGVSRYVIRRVVLTKADQDLKILFKLDGNGQCISINRDRLATISEFPMHGWSDLHFRRMAVSTLAYTFNHR